MPPCRYCLTEAHECICLGCRTRFEGLAEENRRLKRDLDYVRQQLRNDRHVAKVAIVQRLNRARKPKK
jgi:hypothetical protein